MGIHSRSLLLPPPVPEGDPVDQTTARINALNETLRAISTSASDPMLQSQAERNERKLLRRSIYEELGRLVGPEEKVLIRVIPNVRQQAESQGIQI